MKGYPQVVVIRKTFGWALVFKLPLALWGISDSGYIALDGSFSVTLDTAANLTRFAVQMNWINLGFLGIFASSICFVLWNVACKTLGVVKTTIGLCPMPIIGVIFVAVFLNERLTAISAFGGMLIIIGVVMASCQKKTIKCEGLLSQKSILKFSKTLESTMGGMEGTEGG